MSKLRKDPQFIKSEQDAMEIKSESKDSFSKTEKKNIIEPLKLPIKGLGDKVEEIFHRREQKTRNLK